MTQGGESTSRCRDTDSIPGPGGPHTPWSGWAHEPQLPSLYSGAREPCNYWAHRQQPLKSARPRARAPQPEKPRQWEALPPQLEESPLAATREKPAQQQRFCTAKKKKKNPQDFGNLFSLLKMALSQRSLKQNKTNQTTAITFTVMLSYHIHYGSVSLSQWYTVVNEPPKKHEHDTVTLFLHHLWIHFEHNLYLLTQGH